MSEKFKVGQRVELVDNAGMAAPLGAIATVYDVDERYLNVTWGKGANGQIDGGYDFHQFKPLVKVGEQLLFNFMEG